MQGVLWLVHDELPKSLRPSSQPVSPSVCKDEEHLTQGKLAQGEICSTGHLFMDAFPVTSSGVSVLG